MQKLVRRLARSKNAAEMSVALVAVVVIILVIVVILIFITGKAGKTVSTGLSCEARGGACKSACAAGERTELISCKTKDKKEEGFCCVKEE